MAPFADRSFLAPSAALIVAALWFSPAAHAQYVTAPPELIAQAPATPPAPASTPPATPAPSENETDDDTDDPGAGESLAMFDSSVGYIDPAIPGNMIRTIYDTSYGNNRPNRAEFFYAKGAPGGPGLPFPETSVDFQTISAYVERGFTPRFSGFVNVPIRFLNPQVNANEWGPGDMDTGMKYAFQRTDSAVSTFQLRTFIPTGNPNKGLGNNHVSLEPALLVFRKLAPRWRFEGELRYWVPIGGTDFAGDIVRYGAGLSYGCRPQHGWWVSPVAEVVGWTVLSGKESAVFAPGGPAFVMNAAGDTIVNAKVGVRVGIGQRVNVYAGYGRALTGDVWYKDTARVELRWMY